MINELRLLDVFAFGPMMIWAGTKEDIDISQVARLILVLGGIGTMYYNGVNYLRNAGIVKEVK